MHLFERQSQSWMQRLPLAAQRAHNEILGRVRHIYLGDVLTFLNALRNVLGCEIMHRTDGMGSVLKAFMASAIPHACLHHNILVAKIINSHGQVAYCSLSFSMWDIQNSCAYAPFHKPCSEQLLPLTLLGVTFPCHAECRLAVSAV